MPRPRLRTWLASLAALLSFVLAGYDANPTTLVSTPYLAELDNPFPSASEQDSIRRALYSCDTATFILTALLLTPCFMQRQGRRGTLLLGAVYAFVGALIQVISPNKAVAVLGRFFATLGKAFALPAALVYIAEVASTADRGVLLSLAQTAYQLGSFLVFWVHAAPGTATRQPELAARVTPLVQLYFPLLLLLGMLLAPESPRWLASRGRYEAAMRALATVRDEMDPRALEELEEIIRAAPAPEKSDYFHQLSPYVELVVNSASRHRLLLALGLGLGLTAGGSAQVVSDAGAAYAYAFWPRQQGTSLDQDPNIDMSELALARRYIRSSTGPGLAFFVLPAVRRAIELVSAAAAPALIKRVGRRRLLLLGAGASAVLLVPLGAVGGIANVLTKRGVLVGYRTGWATWTIQGVRVDNPRRSLGVLYAIFSTLLRAVHLPTLGAGVLTYTAEMFGQGVRAHGVSIALAFYALLDAVLNHQAFARFTASAGLYTFFLFAGVCLVLCGFVYVLIPETRGADLEEMEDVFEPEEPYARAPSVMSMASIESFGSRPRSSGSKRRQPLARLGV
ncbi:hypothetical protein Q8F55_005832 [Vanrija albida]|uniref:Major facilitator superfamily (MFS) profile domain-containing protein n=1 Tax=Vanrija albida TaxID=181172 RepID=A0ABR3Q3Q9_9TREE